MNGDLLPYKEKDYVLLKNIIDLLRLAHDSPIAGCFSYSMTSDKIQNFRWKSKTQDVDAYCSGCFTCQTGQDNRSKPLGIAQPLEIFSRRLKSVSMGFKTILPTTAEGLDYKTTHVDCLPKTVHIISARSKDTAEKITHCFFKIVFPLHGLPGSLVSDRGLTSLHAFCNNL